MKAVDIKVEYLREPLGIDVPRPRFDWNCDEGIRQSAYRILCKDGNETLWNSGKVESSRMSHVVYEGKQLRSRQHVDVDIVLWDEKGKEGETSSSSFEMGLLAKEDFLGKWITGNYEPVKDTRYPLDYFRKTFLLKKKTRKARLYITALGIYSVFLNGKRISDECFMPGATDYDKRLQYQVYDVTDLLKENNELTVELGDGWYRGSLGAYGAYNVFGMKTKLYLQLEIEAEDGSQRTIVSDGSFDWSNDGPVRFNDLKDGEVYDASMRPSYRFKAVESEENRNLCASNNVPVRKKEVFQGKELGGHVYDFSQNMAGILSFKVKAHTSPVSLRS